ncbi:MAG: glycine--tRNA ligase subunit beta [Methylothermaceae bacteria B42]|nr:MAG: glycine--tRNA ligase subunit beta [Methylothermaceae bacteria B42]
MASRDLLFELGTEELPPKALHPLMTALRDETAARLEKAHLRFESIKAYATPRRLALIVHGLAETQPDKSEVRRGPALQAAFGPGGEPTPAALGFAKSCGVEVADLETLKNAKGEWLCCQIHTPGARTQDLIGDVLQQSLAALPIPKRMRWSDLEVEFVRPAHWAVLLFGEEVIPTQILNLKAGNITFGHRFHSPEPLTIANPDHYAQLLFSEGWVIADFDERQARIEEQANKLANQAGGRAHIDSALLQEVTALVEWPVAVMGNFDERFLQLPPEVLITVMQSHQKYFPVRDDNHALLPCFITMANLDSKRLESVREGNERVIRPRLADAEFFWHQDLKIPLEQRLAQLAGIIFQHKLGTLLDKTRRLEKLAVLLADKLHSDSGTALRAAQLSKTDLTTEMVGEFPELQGIMGRYYAQAQGEHEEIAAALEEQYRPRFAGGPLPETRCGEILALADKLDTLVGIFSIGQIPTGAKDPYALRRAALGIIRILIEKQLDLDLKALLQASAENYSHDFDHPQVLATLENFIFDRLKGYLLEKGFTADEFEAVAALKILNLLDFLHRIEAVHAFRQLPEAESLAAANKRIRNILRKSGLTTFAAVDSDRLQAPEEKALLTAVDQARKEINPFLHRRDYTQALQRLAQLKQTVDAFFDHVMVMVEDESVRQNRLNLLHETAALFLQIADISRLQG